MNREAQELLARGVAEIDGQSVEVIVGSVKGEKELWLGGGEIRRRLSAWMPDVDAEAAIAQMRTNLSDARVFVLGYQDVGRLVFLWHKYRALLLDDESFDSADPAYSSAGGASAMYCHHHIETLPALRGGVYAVASLSDARTLASNLHHELGHAMAGSLFSETLPPNPDLPKPHATTDPHGVTWEGQLEYLASPDEIDVRARAAIAYLAPEWTPDLRPADHRDVARLRTAGKWSLPGDVRTLAEHFDDAGIVWALNSMPAL